MDELDHPADPRFDLPAQSFEPLGKRARYYPMTQRESELLVEERKNKRRDKARRNDEAFAEYLLLAMKNNRKTVNYSTVNSEAIPFHIQGGSMVSSHEYKYHDFRVQGQHYCPMNRNSSIADAFMQTITQGVGSSNRDRNTIVLKSIVLRLSVILPERSVHELEAGVLDDDLQFYVILDKKPSQGHPTYDKILSVHDDQHIIMAWPNPRYSDRFVFLHSQQFNMRYQTLWEYTRADADKKSVCLGVMEKRTIELPVDGIHVTYDPEKTGYSSMLENNLFFCFITAKGVHTTSGHLSEVKEMQTFDIDWTMRVTHY